VTNARVPSSRSFSTLVQGFFCQRLLQQRNASPRTVAAYRDTFRLLLCYVQDHRSIAIESVTLRDLDAVLVCAFLDYLEQERHNSIRTRNARLAALRSFFHYAATQAPEDLPNIQRVLAISGKRHDTPLLGFLTHQEVGAVRNACDLSTWSGRRDHALFTTLYNTGARVSEAINLRVVDLQGRSSTATLHLRGKGRKERMVPLWKSTARLLASWLGTQTTTPQAPLFPNRDGEPMTRTGVAHRLRLTVTKAMQACPSLRSKRISPHTLRHTTAMHLLQAGVDITVIALWLGHENPSTTHCYVEADLAMKRRALAALDEPTSRRCRFKPNNTLLSFLEGL